jgi:hypothetical protein
MIVGYRFLMLDPMREWITLAQSQTIKVQRITWLLPYIFNLKTIHNIDNSNNPNWLWVNRIVFCLFTGGLKMTQKSSFGKGRSPL